MSYRKDLRERIDFLKMEIVKTKKELSIRGIHNCKNKDIDKILKKRNPLTNHIRDKNEWEKVSIMLEEVNEFIRNYPGYYLSSQEKARAMQFFMPLIVRCYKEFM